MTVRQPATRWEDALPSGNGKIGALVYGNIRHEIILLNHEALWLRKEKPTLPTISQHLSELRAMLAEGRYKDAAGFLDSKLWEAGYPARVVDPYYPAFDLQIEPAKPGFFEPAKIPFTHYRRSVSFETGEVSVTWKEGEATFERQLFVSRADDIVVMRMKASQDDAVSCRLRLLPHGLKAEKGMDYKNMTVPGVPITFESTVKSDQTPWPGKLTINARYENGAEFGGVARIVAHGGLANVEDDWLQIKSADEAIILIKLYANENGAAAQERIQAELARTPTVYEYLLGRHVPLHSELFLRARLDLEASKQRKLTNDELLMQAYDGDVPASLIERMFDYGRYLLICSSVPGGLPANLQGVWNGDYAPAWDSDYHNDENIQMNYWQALPGNLAEATLPYFDYYESFLDDYRANAKAVYGCRGILAPISQSTHGLIHPGPWVNWTAGAGWLAQLFYDYWLFTGDRQFLEKRAVPFMKEVALFYEDFLVEDKDGKLMFAPSLSPENVPDIENGSLVTVNATMDVAVCKEVLTNLCAACEMLGIEQEGVQRWRVILAKLPAYEVNNSGAIREWLHPGLYDNYNHRHQSHIYPLFPGLEITQEGDRNLFEAMRVAVEKRLTIGPASQTGWSLAHMANIYARLGDGNRALECLEIMARSCVGTNLFTYHNDWRAQGLTLYWGHGRRPPFQIDANFGLAAAVLEMLVFSKPGMVKLLPALPAKWRRGNVEGIRCRAGIEIGMNWNMDKEEIKATLLSSTAQTVTIKFPGEVLYLQTTLRPRSVSVSSYGPTYREMALPAGERVTMDVVFRREQK